MPTKSSFRRSWSEVKNSELTDIRKRHAADPPSADELVGLTFSGGGIRSATFGLGVLEALKDLELLEKVHYMSTVSGGGYIGSWLTANCARHKGWLTRAADWKESIKHLRRYSNYLSPEVGFFSADTWSMFTIWFRNALLVQLTVILAVACVLTVPRPLILLFQHWPDVGLWRWTSVILFLIAVVGIAGNEQKVGSLQTIRLLQAAYWRRGLGCSVALGLIAWLYASWWHFTPFPDVSAPALHDEAWFWAAVPVAILLVAAAYCLQPVAVMLFGWRGGPDSPTQINYTQAWVQRAAVFPIMATCFLVAAILWGESTTNAGLARLSYGGLLTTTWQYWPFPLAVVFFSLWLLSLCGVRDWRKGWNFVVALLAPIVCVVALHALLCAIMLLQQQWADDQREGLRHAFVFTPALVLFAFSLTVVLLIGMLGRNSTEGIREWWSRLGAWLSIYGTAWMIVALAAVYGPDLFRALFNRSLWTSLPATFGWIGTVAGGLMAGRSPSTGARDTKKGGGPLSIVAEIAPFVFIAGLLVSVAAGIDAIVQLNALRSWSDAGSGAADWTNPFLSFSVYVLAGSAVALTILAARVDVNEFSLNAFYRSRLVRCYLGASRYTKRGGQFFTDRKPQNFTGFDDADDVPLAKLASSPPAPADAAGADAPGDTERLGLLDEPCGPFHLVNCALNLGGSSDLALHTRHSASFTLTPLHCGSGYLSRTPTGATGELGYIATADYGGQLGAPTLGQAVSVSGAAASPNMGYHTSPVVAFLLTVFNVRLGWWFPNPNETAHGQASPRFNLPYMFAELFGVATDKSKFLMISDGGHFENLGVYELIRRRCRVIIVSDAECDPGLAFEGLGTLIRVCEVDFQTRIMIDVGSLRAGKETSWSSNRCAAGHICYPDGTTGVLIYLKATMTGNEDTAILQYKASHPTFPHESTGDQFYREDQFESYRGLGYDVAHRAFGAVSQFAGASVVERATKLLDVCSASLDHVGRFTDQSTRLMELWKRIGSNKEFAGLDASTIGASATKLAEDARERFYLCCQMIQLMENVYLDLDLDQTWEHPDNKGWQSMFRMWAACEPIQETWGRTSTIFGLRFQYFCNRELKLPLSASHRTGFNPCDGIKASGGQA
jgi:Patatin-like phospholipase